MRTHQLLALLSLSLWSGCTSCLGNDCNFTSRCDAGVLQICGLGVDQQIGRTVASQPCPTLNPVCVEENGNAVCTAGPATRCDAGLSRCEGDTLVQCSRDDWNQLGGFVVRTTCADATGGMDPFCVEPRADQGSCKASATPSCTTSSCESADIEVRCENGYPDRTRCGGKTQCHVTDAGGVECI